MPFFGTWKTWYNNQFDTIAAQDNKHHLAYLNGSVSKFQLKPDIVINNGIIIADTKWKILSEDKTHQGVSQSDMYQLYAYGTKYKNCKDLFLIYPLDKIEANKGRCYQYFKDETCESNNGLKLEVLFFDVAQNFEKYDFKL